MIARFFTMVIGALLAGALAVAGLYVWTYAFGNPQGSLFDNSLDAYNIFERFLIGLSLAGGGVGWWVGGKLGKRARPPVTR